MQIEWITATQQVEMVINLEVEVLFNLQEDTTIQNLQKVSTQDYELLLST